MKVIPKADLRCFWCHQPAPDTPYRSPIPDVVGGRFVVCGPQCPERPDDTLVLTDWGSWKNDPRAQSQESLQ